MLGALSSLTGGGGLSAGGGGPSTASTGDSSAGVTTNFASNNAFQVGGSGKQEQNAPTSTAGGLSTQTLTLAAVGVGLLVVTLAAYAFIRPKS